MESPELRGNIESLQIGAPGAPLSFGQRLARENAWSTSFADKVITEYKRFIYLTAISKKEITPSDQVDQAWHLHLTYTGSYWKDLCEDILGFSLHHNPTKGGPEEQQRFRAQYSFTLSFYEQVFGEPPPDDVWPPVEKRFDAVEEFVRVNSRHSWVIRKPSLSIDKLFLLLVLPLVLAACSYDFSKLRALFWVVLLILVVFLVYKLVMLLLSGGGSGRNSGGGTGCGACGGCGGCGG